MSRLLPLALLALTVTVAAHAAKPAPTISVSAKRGLAFAEQRCAGCHAVAANGTSPNPESPSFEDIANRPGVTAQSLHQFLRSSHNYPAAMNFRVDAARVRDLANYIATLRKPNYRPVM